MKRLCLAAALFAATITAGIARGSDAAARAELTAIYHKVDVGLEHKNTAPLAAVLSQDFTLSQGTTTYSRTQAIQFFTQQFKTMPSLKTGPTTIISFKVRNGKAVVATKSTSSASQVDPNGKSHKIVDTNTALDTWVKTARGWQLMSSTVTSDALSIDGKPLAGAPGK